MRALISGSVVGHFHGGTPASEKTVLECSVKRIQKLITSGKIDPLWQVKSQDSASIVEMKKGKEWKVTDSDPAAKDSKKSNLYLFFTHEGNFLAANHTGK